MCIPRVGSIVQQAHYEAGCDATRYALRVILGSWRLVKLPRTAVVLRNLKGKVKRETWRFLISGD